MGCCGQKRTAFKRQMENSTSFQAENPADFEPPPDMKPRIFEYTGRGALTLRGISSGAVYQFRFPGEKLEVDYYDSFAMMAERDLKIVS